jgi:tripartite motif-containing protein 71
MIRRALIATCLAGLALLAWAAPAGAASGNWDRAWGRDVDSVLGGTGFEICTVAANCKIGTHPNATPAIGGALEHPTGVATDGAGNVYVADYFNDRVQKFDSSGNFLRAWGRDVVATGPEDLGNGFEVCTIAANCQAGSTGGAKGELSSPVGIAADVTGHVWVADSGNNRIQRFDSQGNFEYMWGKDVNTSNPGVGFEQCGPTSTCKTGLTGDLGGEFNTPQGVAVGAGLAYVADTGNDRIEKFDATNGVFLLAAGKNVDFTAPGAGPEVCVPPNQCQNGDPGAGLGGEFGGPNGVATDAAGHLYVADSGFQRVQRFNAAGLTQLDFELMWGEGVDGGTAGTGAEVCTLAADCLEGIIGTLGGELSEPNGVVTDSAGNVYVGESDNGRVQKFGASGVFQRAWGKDVDSAQPGTGFEICTVAANCKIGENTTALGGEFSDPWGVAVDGAGALYVADTLNHRIQKFVDAAVTPGPGASSPTPPPARAKKCKKKKRHAAVAKKKKKKCKKKKT